MKKWWVVLSMILMPLASGLYTFHALARPLKLNAPVITTHSNNTESVKLDWPEQGRAAVGLAGEDSCRANGSTNAFPTASIAKVITALVVLDKHPLKSGENGPTLTMTSDDVARLIKTQEQGGSYVSIANGEQLTEKQMFQAILLESANNLADSLAIWAFGSLENYQAAAEKWLKQNNLSDTTIGTDASGFDPSTKSTAANLCKIMLLAIKDPALMEIMGTAEIGDFPVAGNLKNTNELLGQSGVFAGKTGFTDDAGHGVILATKVTVDSQSQIVALAVLGQDSYDEAFALSQKLIESIESSLTLQKIQAGQTVGQITSDWGNKTDLIVGENASIVTWIDQHVEFEPFSQPLTACGGLSACIDDNYVPLNKRLSLRSNEVIGTLNFGSQSVSIKTKNSLPAASFLWRLSHGF